MGWMHYWKSCPTRLGVAQAKERWIDPQTGWGDAAKRSSYFPAIFL